MVHVLPVLHRCDLPNLKLEETERADKLQIAGDLKSAIARGLSDQDLADAVHSALAKSNMLQWRAYWPMSPKGNADRRQLWPALRALVEAALGTADGHAGALAALVAALLEAVSGGKPETARQTPKFLFLPNADKTRVGKEGVIQCKNR